ncbi:3D domain-containing protein [Neomoorella thermoacetica]|nr:3D domain-containing protein [Moorella thermoacetica]
MLATAYTASSEEGTADGRTATGIKVRRGVVAVDPKVIPLGTKLYIEGYGEAIAADTGGAIKGNKIDLFMDSKQEALRWGRRWVLVTIY